MLQCKLTVSIVCTAVMTVQVTRKFWCAVQISNPNAFVMHEYIMISFMKALAAVCCDVDKESSCTLVHMQRPCLFAAHRRQAVLHELQRLQVEGSSRPGGCSSDSSERGSLLISDVTLLLKKDYLRAMAAGNCPG
jgi:hypothetical protein